jgi:subtilisin family serine protease
LQQAAGENQLALQTLASLLKLAGKPADNLEKRVVAKPLLQAAIETHGASGPAFAQAFRKYCRAAWDALPWDSVRDAAKSVLAHSGTFNSAALIGQVKAAFDPAVQKSGVLDNGQAWELIRMRNVLRLYLPVSGAVPEILRLYIASHDVRQDGIWQAREVTLPADPKLTPVNVAIWDSGLDVALFAGQLFSDPHPTASGNHGLAFDGDGQPSTSWLFPLTAAQQRQYPDFLAEEKGIADLQDGIDSPEASAARARAASLTSDQLRDRKRLQRTLDHYAHGTHVAGIAARGNPAVRLVVARFDCDVTQLPFQPTTEWAHRMAADFRQFSDYFRTRNVRVVNMSWNNDPAESQRRAAEVYGIWRDALESAIRSAPNTLFVCAAGNNNRSAGFAQDVPASLHLPNLIAVGAVNEAGKETGFTSYGDTVVVHANGYEVESYVPGGSRMRMSGTSMAAPNVANLAAKLIALDPSLTPAQTIGLIKRGATASEDGRLRLIDAKASVALLQAGK